VAYPGILLGVGGSTNSVEDREQRERGSGVGSPLVRDSAQFAVRFDFVRLSGCTDVFSTDLLCQKFRISGGGGLNPPRYATDAVHHSVVTVHN
jgi:hypothetical protein